MADFEIPESAFEGENVGENIDQIDTERDNLNNYMNDNVQQAGSEEYKAQVNDYKAQIRDSTTNFIKNVAKAAGKDILDTDTDIKNCLDDIDNIDFNNPESVTQAKQTYDGMSSQFKSVLETSIKKNIGSISDSFKSSLSSDAQAKITDAQNETAQAVKDLAKEAESDKPDADKMNENKKTINKNVSKVKTEIEKEPSLVDKITSKLGKTGTRIMAFVMALGALAGTVTGIAYLILKLIADNETGCYIFYNDGKANSVKLDGCSDFYSSSIANQALCSCGAVVVPNVQNKGLTDAQCSGIPSECDKPYCIGRCDTSKQRCSGFPNEYNLQCTSGGIADTGYVNYAYELHTPGSVLSDLGNGIKNFFPNLGDWLSSNIKTILMYIGIGLAILLVGSVIFRFAMNSFSK